MAGSAPEAIFVGLGAVPGAWLRLILVNRWAPMVPKKHWGTFGVNVFACFALGLLSAVWDGCEPGSTKPLVLIVGVGFFGGFSTFSTFVMEVLQELQARRRVSAILLSFLSILAGLAAVASGYGIGQLSHV